MKTVCVLILGWLLFDSILTGKNLFGMFMAVVGMVTYSWAVEVAKTQAAKAAAVRIMEPNLQEEDSLLKGDIEFGRVEKS